MVDTHTFNQSKKLFEPRHSKCNFCNAGAHSTSKLDNCFFSVYNIQNRTNLIVYRNVKFKEIKIGVPRCKRCRKVHSNTKMAVNSFMVIGILLVFIIPIYFSAVFNLGVIGMIILMAITFGTVYLGMRAVESKMLEAYKVRSEKEGAFKEPLVREFLANGWSANKPSA